ncbi:MAG: hypothetical protein HFJ38_01980 [Bacilli bacterium]|nr:hypothetical protein [Bacilli bacterium]
MKEKFLDFSINLIEKYQNISEGDIPKLRYGLEGLYLTFTKMIVIFLLAIVLGIFKEILILLFFFNIIRFTGFGFHARKSSECLFLSILSFVLMPFLLLRLDISKNMILIIGILGTIYLFFYAPADTIKRPLPNKKKRIIRKAITVITSIIFTILAFLLNDYTISILFVSSIAIEDIMVSPITYKVFGQPYRNYLNYRKA